MSYFHLFFLLSLFTITNDCSISTDIVFKENFTIDLGDQNTIDMIWVPAGKFTMGNLENSNNTEKHQDEHAHKVEITEGYWLSKYEITQKQWIYFMGSTILEQQKKQYKKWKIRGIGDTIPMYFISWEECIDFCKKLNIQEKKQLPKNYQFSLPTEAQWEFAAKNFSNTSVPLDSIAWYRSNSNKTIHPVGQKKPNKLGIHDLRGNLSEWCYDWYGKYPLDSVINPTGPKNGERKVVRGGSWFGVAYNTQATTRFSDPPKNGYTSIGLRLALRKIK